MIRLTDLTAELQRLWEAQNDEAPTQFPGTSLDASRLESWYEFWISEAMEPVHRAPDRDGWLLLIDVHCFARGANKRRAQELADRARTALGQRYLTIAHGAAPQQSKAGLRILEAAVRDLTREGTGEAGLRLQHLAVSFRGRAECVAGAPAD